MFTPAKRRAEDSSPTTSAKKPKTDASITSFFGQPKITPAATHGSTPSTDTNSAAAKFDKEKWIATLSEEHKRLLKLEIETLDLSWLPYLKDEITQPSFLELKRFLEKEVKAGQKIFPPMNEVYSWSRHTPLTTVRVVIIGQDPYIRDNQAHGLSFSVRPPTPAPPSLKNMYIALAKDYPGFKPPANNGGLLTPWAEQGVLMLNTCLTVRAGVSTSHANKGWEQFTQKVIDVVAKTRTRGVVFLAWGSPAQKRCAKVSGAKHLVLRSVHPSPLSAAKGFFDCGHFKKTNEFLEQKYGKEGVIDWNLDKKAEIKAPATKDVKVTASVSEKAGLKGDANAETKLTRKETGDEFEDDDAMEALKELANSDPVIAPEVAAQEETKQTEGKDAEEVIEQKQEEDEKEKENEEEDRKENNTSEKGEL